AQVSTPQNSGPYGLPNLAKQESLGLSSGSVRSSGSQRRSWEPPVSAVVSARGFAPRPGDPESWADTDLAACLGFRAQQVRFDSRTPPEPSGSLFGEANQASRMSQSGHHLRTGG